MKYILSATAIAGAIAFAGPASAEGALNIYSWGNIMPPDMIKKFEEEYDIKVTVTDYDSNDTALAKIRQGGHGFDVVVPTSSHVQIWVNEGFLLETNPNQMENFSHVGEQWRDPPHDPGSRYTVPLFVGTTGIIADKKTYSGDINTSAIFLDPPPELVGKINVAPVMDEVMHLVVSYFGGEFCTTDVEILRKVRDKLVEAKPKWASMTYGNPDMYAKVDVAAGVYWSGAAYRVRVLNENFAYGYPKEGYPIWMDTVAVLSEAQNVENAKLFQNFLMTPEAAAMITEFTRYPNAIPAADALLPEEMRTAPEVNIPAESAEHGSWLVACPPEANEIYTQIWTAIQR